MERFDNMKEFKGFQDEMEITRQIQEQLSEAINRLSIDYQAAIANIEFKEHLIEGAFHLIERMALSASDIDLAKPIKIGDRHMPPEWLRMNIRDELKL